ncbi:hypothetical protein C2E31_14920 [Rhodopirellula baltica]|nr:hypothetical protein C2E31_14920 [Rhodopirellula baltica]
MKKPLWKFRRYAVCGALISALGVPAVNAQVPVVNTQQDTPNPDAAQENLSRQDAVSSRLPESILEVDYVMFNDPSYDNNSPTIEITSEAIDVWLTALKRPETQLRRQIVDTVSVAKRREMPGIERTIPTLLELIADESLDVTVRRSLIGAFSTFDDPQYGPLLAEQSRKYGSPIATLAEPVLARWKDVSMVDDWAKRLASPNIRTTDLRMAIDGLGAVKHQASADAIRSIVFDQRKPASVRLCAAEALGHIKAEGLEADATELGDQTDDRVAPLLAVRLLSDHTSPESIEVLRGLAERDFGIVKAAALKRLYDVDPTNAVDLARTAVGHLDFAVRDIACEILFAVKDEANVAPLAELLPDENPTLRRKAASYLYLLAIQSGMVDKVIAETSGILDQDDWRGCEQATRVLVSLDHKPAGDRLVDLMRHPRGETMIAAGWGLRLLRQKQHLGAMLGRANEIYDGFGSKELNTDSPGVHDLQTQLFLAFGQLDYTAAESLMRTYVPRNLTLGDRARGAACWSLGIMHEGEVVDELVTEMMARLRDTKALIPEYDTVRQMCATSMGRMKAERSLPALREYAAMDRVGRACFWAIEQITGEPSPPPGKAPMMNYHDWFLKPIDTGENSAE